MAQLFYTTCISIDLAHHAIFHAKDVKGGTCINTMFAYRRPITLHFAFYEHCFMIESSVIGKLKRIFDINQCVGGRYLPAEKHTIRKRVDIVYVDALFPSQQFCSCQDGKLVEQSCHQFRFWYIKHMCKPAVNTYIYKYKHLIKHGI